MMLAIIEAPATRNLHGNSALGREDCRKMFSLMRVKGKLKKGSPAS